MNDKKSIIYNIHDLIEILKTNPKKILLCESLFDWLLCSNWNCVLSDKLKFYIKNGGTVEKIEEGNKQ